MSLASLLSQVSQSPDREEQVRQLYRDILGREADPSGLANWVNSPYSIRQITDYFNQSPEHVVGHAALPANWQDQMLSEGGPGLGWTQSHNLEQIGFKAGHGYQLSPEEINFLQHGSSVAPQYTNGVVTNGADIWNDYVARQQDREDSPSWYEKPATQFAALTGGLGGMTGANLATGGNVGQGVTQDLAGLAAGAGLAAALPATGLSTVAGASPTLLADAGTTAIPGVTWDAPAASGALGSGIAGGTTASGIGGGATGTGITAGATGASGIGTAGATGALAPGYFASETAYPVFGGLSGTGATGTAGALGGGAATVGGAAAGGSALSRIVSGNGTAADYLGLAGSLAPAALGYLGATKSADAFSDLGNKYLAVGAPSRARLEASYAPGFSMSSDPGFSDALAQTTKETLHQLSPNGNPVGSPNAWAQTLQDVNSKFAYPALQNYRSANAASGGLGALTAAAPGAETNAIKAGQGQYDSIGAGLADIFAAPRSLSDLLREARRGSY